LDRLARAVIVGPFFLKDRQHTLGAISSEQSRRPAVPCVDLPKQTSPATDSLVLGLDHFAIVFQFVHRGVTPQDDILRAAGVVSVLAGHNLALNVGHPFAGLVALRQVPLAYAVRSRSISGKELVVFHGLPFRVSLH
jgi:hypothetical protein